MADAPLILLDTTFVLDLDAPPPRLWGELNRRIGDDPAEPMKPLDLLLAPSACQLSTATRILGPARLSPFALTVVGALFLRL